MSNSTVRPKTASVIFAQGRTRRRWLVSTSEEAAEEKQCFSCNVCPASRQPVGHLNAPSVTRSAVPSYRVPLPLMISTCWISWGLPSPRDWKPNRNKRHLFFLRRWSCVKRQRKTKEKDRATLTAAFSDQILCRARQNTSPFWVCANQIVIDPLM